MIKRLLRELEETWALTTETIDDLHEKMEEIAHEYYWEGFKDGHNDNLPKMTERSYGKKEDQQ